MNNATDRVALRLAAVLLLAGQILYVVITLFHADGNANDHPAVFAEYAASVSWTIVHIAQFGAMAILLAGLLALYYAIDRRDSVVKWAGRFGAASAIAAFALYGALQAVDGIANKQADLAWTSASAADKAARFASAEAVRWIEWGLRSYQDFTLGLALLMFALAIVRSASVPRAIGYLIGLTGLIYLAQGWIVGVEGFSQTMSIAIVLSEIIGLIWMIWLSLIAWRLET